jgi:hypothetical protein
MITWCLFVLLNFIDIQKKQKQAGNSVNLNEIKKDLIKPKNIIILFTSMCNK